MITNNLAMTGTFSKSPFAWGFEEDLAVTSAQDCFVGLNDGRTYIDWVSGLGSNLYGYGYFVDAITNELQGGGGSHSLPHKLEYEAANLLVAMLADNIPNWISSDLQARFCLSGTDAVSMAVRLARAVTGHNGILCVSGGYHGWADWTVARTQPARGVPEAQSLYTRDFIFNDLNDLKFKADGFGVAAVVIEQGLQGPTLGPYGFYNQIRHFCDKTGALFIMDEVVTGLRYGLGGVSGLYNIKPDLVCMGKALGNGAPVAAVVGEDHLMGEFAAISPVFCSSTHWGNSLNMAAAKAVLSNWGSEQVNHIACIGQLLRAGLRAAGWKGTGDDVRHLVQFDSLAEQAFFISGMRKQGFLMNRPNFPTMSHTTDLVDQTVQAAIKVRAKYKCALERGTLDEKVKGKLPRVLFSDR